jgi:hypothetical protein
MVRAGETGVLWSRSDLFAVLIDWARRLFWVSESLIVATDLLATVLPG